MAEVQNSDTLSGSRKEFFGHPRGLVICFLTEMWERFSYYGMRGLLLLYLVQHFLFTDGEANLIYCLLYTSPSPRDQRGSRMPSSA